MGNVMEETWSPEPVKAWRYWHVPERFWNFDNHRWEATLHGQMEPWESAIKFAEHKELFESHPCPEPGCGCGINAVKSLTWKDISGWLGFCTCGTCEGNHYSMIQHNPVAVGEVALSGIVDEYEFGYRAEQAEILRLIVIAEDRRIADTLEVCYGVPVSWETPTGPLVAQLWKEHQNGHREADTSDHRGTGTSEDTGAGERTRKGWSKVKEGAKAVGFFMSVFVACVAVLTAFGLLMVAIGEWTRGNDQDAECLRVANLTGGVAEEIGTFGGCRIVLPSGLIVNEDAFQWKEA